MKIRVMKKRDWKKCLELWQNIPEMGLNSIDDTKEGIVRFLRRNPKTCFVAETDGIFAGTILLCTIAGNLIKTVPLGFSHWMTVIGLAFMVVPVDWVRKIIVKRRRR